jgi:4-diphosphocytidyl-2-C-methyl-D-erythritol kinase
MLAPAKVNLCLFLGPARAMDSKHELVTVFQALSLADVLTVSASEVDEVVCPGIEGPNLAMDALVALRGAGWNAPPVRVSIEKRIPVAAGMGGGSSDAAAVLTLGAETVDIEPLARRLGADVAALVQPGIWLGTGAGEELSPLPRLAEHAYVVLPSAFGLSTPEVYGEADRLGIVRSAEELEELAGRVRRGLEAEPVLAPELIVNDLAAAALSLCPSIQDALDALGAAGAHQAIVSGSGPTTVGIWWGEGASEAADVAATALSPRFPGAQAALPYNLSSQFDRTA